MNKKILFVDDEIGVLQGLKRALRCQRDVWDMVFVSSGNDALKQLESDDVDMIVTDMKMPGMNGAELLEKVADHYPKVIRIVLSGHADEHLTMRAACYAHQYLSKPCDTEFLKDALEKVLKLRGYLNDDNLCCLVNGLKSLPSLPSAYHQIVRCMESETASLEDISAIINKDPAMLAKTMQLVNSAFFGLGRRITNSLDALSVIGVEVIKSLILTIGVFDHFHAPQPADDSAFSANNMLHHSLKVARLSERIARTEHGSKTLIDDCFLAGMLHSIGILILKYNLPEKFDLAQKMMKSGKKTLIEAEDEVYGTNHEAVGAYILGLWGLPNDLVEALAFHNNPSDFSCDELTPLIIVHAADALLQEHEEQSMVARMHLDRACAENSILKNRIDVWRELITEESQA